MEVRRLGRTGLAVTPIGLGLAAIGRPGYINLGHAQDLKRDYDLEAMEANAHQMLDTAWQAGVRYFDVARSYGQAEAFLGSWLSSRGIDPEAVTIGSKWGYIYTAGWRVEAKVHEVKDHSLAVLRRQMQESRELLGRHLDLYQIHSATLESGVLEDVEVLSELGRLRAGGLQIGLTLSGVGQADTLYRAMEIEIDGSPLFGSVQATWNLLEPSAGQALQEAHRLGMGVIVKEALANGRLTSKNQDPEFVPKRALLEQAAAAQGTTIDALAMAAVLARPWVDVVLSGSATREHLLSNLRALNLTWSEELEQRLAPLAEPPESYWARRSAQKWN